MWYTRLAWAVRAVLGLALLEELVTGDVAGALTLALFVALSFAYLLREERLPNVFDALVALSALMNAFGFAVTPGDRRQPRLWPPLSRIARGGGPGTGVSAARVGRGKPLYK